MVWITFFKPHNSVSLFSGKILMSVTSFRLLFYVSFFCLQSLLTSISKVCYSLFFIRIIYKNPIFLDTKLKWNNCLWCWWCHENVGSRHEDEDVRNNISKSKLVSVSRHFSNDPTEKVWQRVFLFFFNHQLCSHVLDFLVVFFFFLRNL